VLLQALSVNVAQAAWEIASAVKAAEGVEWSVEELAQEIAIKTLKTTAESSYHLVRIRTAEKPHVHERHDAVAVILEGRVEMHYRDRVVELGQGDIFQIAKGAPHWAKTISEFPTVAYVIFTPAFDGKDRRVMKAFSQ